MKEATFTLETGKEVPARLNGTEIRYDLPTTIAECVQVCGGDEAVAVSVFNEGFNLNHRQKIAKRFAAREGSTVESINAGVAAHKPGIRVIGEGKSKVPSERKKVVDEMLAALPPEQRDAFTKRLAALKPVRKPKAEGDTVVVEPAKDAKAPTAAASAPAGGQAKPGASKPNGAK